MENLRGGEEGGRAVCVCVCGCAWMERGGGGEGGKANDLATVHS